MSDYRSIAEALNSLPFDLRIEVIAADLIEQGIDPDDIVIKPAGLFKRRFSRDAEIVKVVENPMGEDELHLTLNRDGIYDTLPEGLFHQPKSKSAFRRKSDMVSNVKTQRAEEDSARKFFLPMENEVFHLRSAIERTERKVFFDLEHSETNDLLINFWKLAEYRRYPTLPIMVKLMPIMYRISGNPEYIKTCYELLLRVPVSISVRHTYADADLSMRGWRLGSDTLGFETVCSDTIMDELPIYAITIGPVAAATIPDYQQGGRMLPYLYLLNTYFLCAGYDVDISIIPNETDCSFDLSREHLYLGLNVTLN